MESSKSSVPHTEGGDSTPAAP
jgi:hypothetical protein